MLKVPSVTRMLTFMISLVVSMNTLHSAQSASYSNSISPKISFLNLQEWEVNRQIRISGLIGSQIVDGPYQEVTDVYAIAFHWRLIFTESISGNLVLEAAYSPGRKTFEFKLDENESIKMNGLNTSLANLNFEVIGTGWRKNNPLQILPYTCFGIGIVSRPSRTIRAIYHLDDPNISESEQEQPVTIKMKDCGKRAGSVNLGVGFQIYYILRLDFRIFLIKPGRIALYRMGLMISY